MKTLDLDDLPPKLAALLTGLQEGEELVLVQHGGVAGRLKVAEPAPPPAPDESLEDLDPDERMSEVLAQFRAAIEDDF